VTLGRLTRLLIGALWLIAPALASANETNASDWLEQGWQLIEQNRPEEAMDAWQNGINQLPDKHLFACLFLQSAPSQFKRRIYCQSGLPFKSRSISITYAPIR